MTETQHTNLICLYCGGKRSLRFWKRYIAEGFVFMVWKCVNCGALIQEKRRPVKNYQEEPLS